MAQPFIGQIQMWGTTFSPMYWTTCSGQLMPINQNQALFSLIGSKYGGDGRITLGVPDLRGRTAMHSGTGPGLTPRNIGDKFGTPTVTLTEATMPSHGHGGVFCYINGADQTKLTAQPSNAVPALRKDSAGTFDFVYADYNPASAVPMNGQTVAVQGGSLQHENRQPLLTLRFCLALEGIYPPRS